MKNKGRVRGLTCNITPLGPTPAAVCDFKVKRVKHCRVSLPPLPPPSLCLTRWCSPAINLIKGETFPLEEMAASQSRTEIDG